MNVDFPVLFKRLDYCKSVIEAIQLRLDGLSKMKIETVFSEDRKTITQSLKSENDDDWTTVSLEVSTAVHHLRSVLDNLTYQIVTSANPNLTAEEKRKLFFPAFESEERWNRNRGVKLIQQSCHKKYFQLFLHLQPFRKNVGWDGYEGNPFQHLSLISNRDKHRQLSVSFRVPSQLDTNMALKFFSEEEAHMPKVTFFLEGVRRGGVFKVIEAEFPVDSVQGADQIEAVATMDPLRLPIVKFLSDMVHLVETVITNFQRFEELDDWISPQA
ncbi:hypothetical protein K3725_09645 [Leisingera sp. S132]|uniref:hypothetical protein n=1 Tax=Leisingera sp. S132 TaxID=2867016 RepID=UPI0021A78928|nr:hypothetical protein [Leisingera sp. S132]UWQ77587.1 hypothetical protein K3725_09645 [Leisingera sp. S132]